MILSIARILFVGCTLALWLALGMPSGAFFAEAWIPSVAWLILGALAVASGRLSRMLAVDEDTYGNRAAVGQQARSWVPSSCCY